VAPGIGGALGRVASSRNASSSCHEPVENRPQPLVPPQARKEALIFDRLVSAKFFSPGKFRIK
jgi:hypothetical protein